MDRCWNCGKAREEFGDLRHKGKVLTVERSMLWKNNIYNPQGFKGLLRFIHVSHIEAAMNPIEAE